MINAWIHLYRDAEYPHVTAGNTAMIFGVTTDTVTSVNCSGALRVYTWKPNTVVTVPADDLAPIINSRNST